MPDFLIVSLAGFDTNFALRAAAGYTPTAPEQRYLDRVSECVASLSDLMPRNRAAESEELRRQQQDVRDRALRVLRRRVDAFVARAAGPERDRAADLELGESYRIEGRYREWMSRIETIPFTVTPVPRDDNPRLNCDLRIDTRDVYIPAAVGQLKTEIDNALTVTKSVFSERESGVSWFWWFLGARQTRVEAVRTRWHEYIGQLLGIAQVGLMNTDPSQAPFAHQDMLRYKNEFTTREAGAVKNHYVRRLGAWCFFTSLIFTILYALARTWPVGSIPHDFRNFFLLAVGALCGTWLSFLLRRATLSFDDLAVLEEDRLNPGMRVLFMTGLATIAGLLFWTQAVIFVLGDFQSGPAIYAHGAWTLLLGLLAGVGERALGTSVAKRANDIPAAIAGAAPTAAARR